MQAKATGTAKWIRIFISLPPWGDTRIHSGYSCRCERDEDAPEALAADPEFARAFAQAKKRIRQMELRFVEETDALRQTLLEIYVAVVLKTPYNDFDTH
jgi:hypothetical protein